VKFHRAPVDLRVYVLLDAGRTERAVLPDLARAAVAGGATLLQYRDKEADTRTLVDIARRIRGALGDRKVPFLVNDRVDVALAADADGVHVGQDDMAAEDARDVLGPSAIVGVSVTRDEHADALADAPIDYACVGAVFATMSKQDAKAPIGLPGLARLAERVRGLRPGLPIGAISGIDIANASDAIAAGADGVAVISAVSGASDPREATRRLREIVDRTLAARGAQHGRGMGRP
jgi:thiamine-phosphate pyrophosphorylase